MAKKSSSSSAKKKGTFRTFEDLERDLESLSGVLVNIAQTVARIEEHVEELDLKTIFTMNAISITRIKHGGIIGISGEPEKTTKKIMQWYREGGREQLVMKLKEAELAIEQKRQEVAAAAKGETEDDGTITETPDDTDPGGKVH